MLKVFKVTFNDGGWHSGPLPSHDVVAESQEEAKEKILEKYHRYKMGGDIWVSEFKIDGYVIEVYDEKSYNRYKKIETIQTFLAP